MDNKRALLWGKLKKYNFLILVLSFFEGFATLHSRVSRDCILYPARDCIYSSSYSKDPDTGQKWIGLLCRWAN